MNPIQLFSLTNAISLLAWIFLLLTLGKNYDQYLIGIIVTGLCMVYSILIFTHFSFSNFKDFGTLAGIKSLFQSDYVVLAGWVHYLAFDLMTGIFIKNNAQKHHIPMGWIIPSLIFTFLLGPFGLLTYFLVRRIKTGLNFTD